MDLRIRARNSDNSVVQGLVFIFCLAICLTFPARSHAEPTTLQLGMSPTTGASIQLHPRIHMAAQLQMRIPDLEENPIKSAWYARLSTLFVIAPILALEGGYAFSHGEFPIDTTFRQEHRILLGATLGSRQREGFHLAVANRTRLESRIVPNPGEALKFYVRPRNETQLSLSFLPELQLSWTGEAIFEPQRIGLDWLQIRSGLFLHGSIPISRVGEPDQETRPKVRLNWLVGDYIGIRPLAFARAKRKNLAPAIGSEQSMTNDLENDRANEQDNSTLFMVLTFGLSASF